MTNPEKLTDRHMLALSERVYPAQKVFCDGLKYHIWRSQQSVKKAPAIISEDDLDLARKSYQYTLSEWLCDAALSYDLTSIEWASSEISKRMSEIFQETLTVMDENITTSEKNESLQNQQADQMINAFSYYQNKEEISDEVAFKITIEKSCEIGVLSTMQQLLSLT